MFSSNLRLIVAIAAFAGCVQAADTSAPPFDLADQARIEAGKVRFNANCAAYCHGFEGSGGKTPAFRGRADLKPDQVFKVITEGRVGADIMPAWAGFSEEKRWELVAYIIHLSKQAPTRP
ncbi:MAG: cytochrome c [Sterolibacteriaceae bacterium]|nr:cytochrome c [Sterolibacteriaceae bacterium]MBK9086137.1 cytochrome c [Sterolibacteriaceae bacterium]